jgi:hypothetical protein
MCICGDFNARIGNLADYIEGVDDIEARFTVDDVENDFGDRLIDLLISSNMCVLNGRLGDKGQYTCISTKGKSTVDYAFIPYEQKHFWQDFTVNVMADIISRKGIPHPEKIPDHSLLTWNLSLPNVTQTKELNSSILHKKWYNLENIPDSFMNLNSNDVVQHVETIEQMLSHVHELDDAYTGFQTFIMSEMDNHLEHKDINMKLNYTGSKSKYKPYWSTDLQELWNLAAEKEKLWLSFKGSGHQRAEHKHVYCKARKAFEKALRKAKRKYVKEEQQHLLDLSENNQTYFWKKLKNIGVVNARKSYLPTEVKDVDGNVIYEKGDALEEWKQAFESIYAEDDTSVKYDNQHLDYVTRENNTGVVAENNESPLNCEISRAEVKEAILRSKLKKAAGVDNIKAEVLKNEVCINLLHKMFNLCFSSGQVPSCWNQVIITPIPKDSSNDPLVPGNYRGIALISVTCKIYCDILNRRISTWLQDNSKLVDEQNGYRKDRNCIDHLYVLNSIINNRIKYKQNTFVGFIDLRKAFDNINHECLWYKLRKFGLQGTMFKAIQSYRIMFLML